MTSPFIWQLSFCVGLRHFTVHAYPFRKGSYPFTKSGRSRKDFRFFASTSDDAIQWVNAFADQQCYVNCLPHPMASKKQSSESSDVIFNEFPPESYVRCKCSPKMLVILNPRSGRGRSSKVFHGLVEPIFKVSSFWCFQTLPPPSHFLSFLFLYVCHICWVCT